jgi:hypothetical protein
MCSLSRTFKDAKPNSHSMLDESPDLTLFRYRRTRQYASVLPAERERPRGDKNDTNVCCSKLTRKLALCISGMTDCAECRTYEMRFGCVCDGELHASTGMGFDLLLQQNQRADDVCARSLDDESQAALHVPLASLQHESAHSRLPLQHP